MKTTKTTDEIIAYLKREAKALGIADWHKREGRREEFIRWRAYASCAKLALDFILEKDSTEFINAKDKTPRKAKKS